MNSSRVILNRILVAVLVVVAAFFAIQYFSQQPGKVFQDSVSTSTMHLEGTSTVVTTATASTTDAEWRKILTPQQYHILREAGTEIPFTGSLEYEKRKGTYYSYGCNKPLFRSEQKYDSGTGWPSFWAPIKDGAVQLKVDSAFGVERTEVVDSCGSHLGHVFDDGPAPTGKRYCMNSGAMYFVPDKEQ